MLIIVWVGLYFLIHVHVNIFSGNLIGIIEIIIFCIPESFNTNISHQLLNYKLIFVDINSKGYFVHKNRFETFVERFLVNKNISESKLYISGQRKQKRDAI